MLSHIVAPAHLTDGDWKRILGCSALLQGCDGHLITWLTEVICHLHPTGVSARPWLLLPLSATTISHSRFMHMPITYTSCSFLSAVLFLLCSSFAVMTVEYTVWLTCFSVMWWICEGHFHWLYSLIKSISIKWSKISPRFGCVWKSLRQYVDSASI